MTGLLTKKYHVAILDNEQNGFVPIIVGALKSWYHNKVIIKTYTNTRQMFEAVNLNKAINKPFDMAVLSPNKEAEQLVLKRVNPDMKVVICKDAYSLHTEASKVML